MEKSFTLKRGELTIPCILTQPEDEEVCRVVLSVHGLGGSTGDAIQYAIAQEMELFSSAVLRFDFPGHGRNPMSDEQFSLASCMDTLLAAAQYAKEQFPQVEDLCIFATGFGAYVTLNAMQDLLELPGSIRLVVQTPSVLMHQTLLSMMGISRETFWAMDRYTFRSPRPITVSYGLYEELQENIALASYPIPFLILHGEEDSYIPMSDIQHLRRLNEKSSLVIIPGTTHRFQEEGAWDMVLDLTRDWFEFQQVLVTDSI